MLLKRGILVPFIIVTVILLSISLIIVCQEKDNPKDVTITITVMDGSFSYKDVTNDVSKLVYRGKKVTWECNVPFTIYFGTNSIVTSRKDGRPNPLSILTTLQSKAIGGRSGYENTTSATISNNSLSGSAKYTIAVWDGKKVWIDDPEVIVDPPGGKGR